MSRIEMFEVMLFRLAFMQKYEYPEREYLLFGTKVWNWIDRQPDPEPMWERLAAENPDLFDNPKNVNTMRFTYKDKTLDGMSRIVAQALGAVKC